MSLQIVIEYRLVGQVATNTVKFDATGYFDLEPGESASVDSVPQHDHAVEYLPLDAAEVEETRIRIEDQLQRRSRTISERFWNRGKNRIIERRDEGETGHYWELIMDVSLCDEPERCEIIRLGEDASGVKLLSHVYIERLPNGSERQTAVYPNHPPVRD